MVLKKRFTSLLNKGRPTSGQDEDIPSDSDTPEANAARGVRLFCESGAASSGEEVLHLPTIVEACVASPAAAAAACTQIRKFLSKENYSRPHVQYNAIMLIRILADNPGPSFTKNMDKNFADTLKHLLRNGQDPSVAQIMRESLDALDREKAYDTNLNTVFAMWRKEKGLMANAAKSFGPRTMKAPPWNGAAQPGAYGPGASQSSGRGLPPPIELAGRIEEARTSAKLLLQLVQSTPPSELLGNDLVKEFSERCIAAQRSVQGYINCDNPAPDDDTMLTLIETNEQLSLAASKHQRAVLQARRMIGPTPSPPVGTANNPNPLGSVPPLNNSYNPPSQPPSMPPRSEAPLLPPLDMESKKQPPSSNSRSDLPLPPALQAGSKKTSETEDDNPFADHYSQGYAVPSGPPPSAPRDGRSESNGAYNQGHGATSRRELTEEEEYARDYPISNDPRTPEQSRRHRDSDVSPIAERGAVTYRY